MFHNFFSSLARSKYFSDVSFHFLSFSLCGPLEQQNPLDYIFLVIIIIFAQFFTSVLAGGLSLEFEWQQVLSEFQDSSRYFDRSQQCCSLYGLDSFSDFHFLQSFFQAFKERSKRTLSSTVFFYKLLAKVQVFVHLFAFFYFYQDG